MKTAKFIFLIIISMMLSSSVFAQRLNKHGLKMVSEIVKTEYTGPDFHFGSEQTFSFGYNDANELTDYIFTQKGTESTYVEEYHLTDKGLFGKLQDDVAVEYTIDDDHHITQAVGIYENGRVKIVRDFTYKYVPEAKQNQVIRYRYTEWFRQQGKTPRYKQSLSNGEPFEDVLEYVYKDGYRLLHYSDESLHRLHKMGRNEYSNDYETRVRKVQKYYNEKHINDTNVDLSMLIMNSTPTGDGLNSVLYITEWLPLRQLYFRNEDTFKTMKFEYIYDHRGNLMEVKEWHTAIKKTGWEVKNHWVIKYVK
ncbi:MAG: hypothetical protein HDR89_05365 [Bacteroides sp.]|nr:hypothetical protein [Bacteroides sp.]